MIENIKETFAVLTGGVLSIGGGWMGDFLQFDDHFIIVVLKTGILASVGAIMPLIIKHLWNKYIKKFR